MAKNYHISPKTAKEFKVTKAVLEEIKEMAGLGMNIQLISDFLGISHTHFYRKAKEHPELLKAAHFGKARTVRKVSRHLMDLIEKGDATSTKFYLQTQAGFSTKTVVEIKNADGGESIPDNLKSITQDPIEAARIYQKLIQE